MELIGSPEAVDLARLCIQITLQQRKGGDGPTVVYSDLERREDTEFLDVPERENCVGFILGAKGATMRQARARSRVRARARRGRGQGRDCIVQVQVHTRVHCRPAPLPPCAAPDGDEAHGLHVLRQRERHPGPRRAHQALCAAPPPLTPAPVPRAVTCAAEPPDALSPRRFFTASPLRHFVSSPLCHFAPSPLCLFASPLRVHTRSR